MTVPAIGGIVLDVAAVLSVCRRDGLYAESVVWACVDTGDVVVLPAAVLAEARAHLTGGQLDVLAMMRDLPNIIVSALDTDTADRCGRLLSRLSSHQRGLMSAAHAAIAGVDRGWPVLTDRGPLLLDLDTRVGVDRLP